MKTSCEHIAEFLKQQEVAEQNANSSGSSEMKRPQAATNSISSCSSSSDRSSTTSNNMGSSVNITEESNLSTATSLSNASSSSACMNHSNLGFNVRNGRVYRRLERIFENVAALKRSSGLKMNSEQNKNFLMCFI